MFLWFPAVKVVGSIVSVEGRRPNPEKLEAGLHMADSHNVKDAKSFLGVSYFSPYIDRYADIADAFYALKEHLVFNWTNYHSRVQKILRLLLTTAPILTTADLTRPFVLY